jgi:putative protein kinase ArgK-like GTPase of G3E family
VETSALQSKGTEKVVEQLESLASALVESGRHKELQSQRIAAEIRAGIKEGLWQQLQANENEIDEKACELAESGGSPYPYINDSLSRVKIDILEASEE